MSPQTSNAQAHGPQELKGKRFPMGGNGSLGMVGRGWPSLLPASVPLHLLFLLPGTNFPSVYMALSLTSFWSLLNFTSSKWPSL